MKHPSVPTNPLVKLLLEQEATGIIELEGYPAPHDGGPVRIYRDLSLERYVEIPQDAVLKFSESKDPEGPCRIFFKSTANVTYTTKTRVSASASVAGSLTVLADEVNRTARSRIIKSSSMCSCTTPSNEIAAVRRSTDDFPGGPGLPPLWCEINCEQWLNSCLDTGPGAILYFWCWLDYYVCRLGCIYGSSGDVIFRRA